MKTLLGTTLVATAALFALPLNPAHGQSFAGMEHGKAFIPDTTVVRPADRGARAHTNHVIRVQPNGGLGPGGGMTPTQIRSFYNLPSTGGANAIAIVDAYHYPTALNDFNVFSSQFGLPRETSTNATASTNTVFQVVYANGSKPRTNGGWAQEAALDIEWAHAMAPGAKIYLIEAASNSYASLFAAVDKARSLPGVKQVSMSWGGGEFSGETGYDSHFPQSSGIVYFASSGDTGGVVEYPSCSPNVVAVGGTSVATDSSGAVTNETGWSGSGGGTSVYEAKPSYQSGVANTGAKRSVPDISSDADPYTGVCVYDSTSYLGYRGWMVFGGTSVAAPSVAGMVNLAGSRYSSSAAQLSKIYSDLGTSSVRDILSGTAGGFHCLQYWDFVTGVGSPQSTSGL
jgi:subtilase family serine protease